MANIYACGFIISWLWLVLAACVNGQTTKEEQVEGFFSQSGHTNNWAVLVCTSRFWFNYRHIANTLSMYRTVKRLGIPDSNIILMLADDVSCNPRNKYPATVYNNAARVLDLYGENVEVDYRGYEVTVENFIRMLTGRVSPDTPRSKRLLSDDRSNIFIYMTGHGGDEFLKFQDAEEISAYDLAYSFEQMWEKRRYHEMFFMIDTCQANTMYSKIYSPNILATGSSMLGESSYSHHTDHDLGVAVIDGFTYYNLDFLENIDMTSNKTLKDLFDSYDPAKIASHPGIRSDLFKRPLDKVKVTDFFGNVQNIELTRQRYPLMEADQDGQEEMNMSTILEQYDQATRQHDRTQQQFRAFNVQRPDESFFAWLQSMAYSPSSIVGVIASIAIISFVCKGMLAA
ncbi:er membrane glycoprotein subunit of theglycosylphosphatidylinositol transamidase complex [Lichtheimia corymbifera JMRC:FSU:9682]|uniref:Er membrane glycoprotein subunit of theglycosylphosphatidylinositol transamidase complex n=1 Tax=Lichtheimia corymbifera JMRC:FSU:9682 TaxID=1263082 RepID=A0A068RTQ0_9FUNG|nr:er membrane glycoprotein subunit of theglycosylphosphatidylinositol transamidase complex [Lichtheimia corymbifera JMRC:FSU:9682]